MPVAATAAAASIATFGETAVAATPASTATAAAAAAAASRRLAEESLPTRRYSQRQLLLERKGGGGGTGGDFGTADNTTGIPHRPEHGSSLSSSTHGSPLSPRRRKASMRRARAASTGSSASRSTNAGAGGGGENGGGGGRRTSAVLGYSEMMHMNAFLPAPNAAVERVQKLQRKARMYAEFSAEEDRRRRMRNANPFRTMAEQRWKETQRLRERRIREAAKASSESRAARRGGGRR